MAETKTGNKKESWCDEFDKRVMEKQGRGPARTREKNEQIKKSTKWRRENNYRDNVNVHCANCKYRTELHDPYITTPQDACQLMINDGAYAWVGSSFRCDRFSRKEGGAGSPAHPKREKGSVLNKFHFYIPEFEEMVRTLEMAGVKFNWYSETPPHLAKDSEEITQQLIIDEKPGLFFVMQARKKRESSKTS
jgi:hypothetical protein